MSGTPADSSLPEGASRRRWYVIGGVVVAVLVAAGIVWAVTSGDDDPDDADSPTEATAEATGETTGDPTDAGTAGQGSTTDPEATEGGDDTPSSPPTTVTPTSGPPATAPDDGPEVGVEELPPVGVDEPAAFGSGLEVRVVGVERFEAEARQPGETAGPAIAVEIEATNDTDRAIDLSGVVVTATDSDGVPLIMNSSDPFSPFTGELAPGESQSGTYVFRADEGVSAVLRIEDAISPEAVIVEL